MFERVWPLLSPEKVLFNVVPILPTRFLILPIKLPVAAFHLVRLPVGPTEALSIS